MGEIKYIGGLIMFGIFAIAIILFAVGFANDNTTYTNLDDDFSGSVAAGKSNLSTWESQVVVASDAFYESEISEGETVRTGGQFKLGPATALSTAVSFLSLSYTTVFGSGNEFAWILTTLGAFLTFITGLLIWKTWKGGSP